MGSGKSTTGKALSALMGYDFIDLDSYIEDKAGMSIPEIFATFGEAHFRAMEAEAVRDVVIMSRITSTDRVVALGGGTVMTGSVQHLIFEDTTCVYLETSAGVLSERIGKGEGRPLASTDFEERLQSRIPVYELAPVKVLTDGRAPEEIAAEILSELNKIEHK